MGSRVHADPLPSSAQTVVRSGSTVTGSTFYTVPAGKTFVLLSAYIAMTKAGGAGTMVCTITVASEDDGSTQAVIGDTCAGSTDSHQSSSFHVRCKAGTAIIATQAGDVPSVYTYGISGYLESA